MNQAQDLEQAILARAERLAREYRDRGERSRDAILREAAEKLRLREEREDSIAKSLGERSFRQQVQAQELKMQSDLDRTRWNLVRNVEARLTERMLAHADDENIYLETLSGFISTAAREIEQQELEVHANARDLKQLKAHWERITGAFPEGTAVRLASDPIDTLAGVLIVSADQRIRVDNTFEGRLARLGTRVQQTILERLLPSGFDTGNIFGG
ncbi:V-type ATP synthase subunit E [Thiorhodovibrio winogradskyi]|uniref:V-type ATP synthase subunit E n=1 Tax=Thiorhodovibrio winogradskyi TaxID=77007 RepID=A0ABZ0SEP3_9GAMM|nr:V-type ATP synthase subunit E family protein [Thiorhodovibrio winogradskyi]